MFCRSGRFFPFAVGSLVNFPKKGFSWDDTFVEGSGISWCVVAFTIQHEN